MKKEPFMVWDDKGPRKPTLSENIGGWILFIVLFASMVYNAYTPVLH
ncbi:MAG: hypothetical protein LBT27_00855 [Prevotellaceae bacterium]|jgi:hypothetical protein|nr:hypothetical protein [Prevotellaceae bacterium]